MMRAGLAGLIVSLCVESTPAQPTSQVRPRCVPFAVERLLDGRAAAVPLPLGLEVRLVPSRGGWQIVVGPQDDPAADYLAPVSPPYRRALHLRIGAGHGVTAPESVQITLRELRFVLSRRDAQLARDIAAAALLGDMQRWKDMARLTTGTLTLRITDARVDDEAVEWLAIAGEACVPER